MEIILHLSGRTLSLVGCWIPQNKLWHNMQTSKMQVGYSQLRILPVPKALRSHGNLLKTSTCGGFQFLPASLLAYAPGSYSLTHYTRQPQVYKLGAAGAGIGASGVGSPAISPAIPTTVCAAKCWSNWVPRSMWWTRPPRGQQRPAGGGRNA